MTLLYVYLAGSGLTLWLLPHFDGVDDCCLGCRIAGALNHLLLSMLWPLPLAMGLWAVFNKAADEAGEYLAYRRSKRGK